jgi:DNA modification methylase
VQPRSTAKDGCAEADRRAARNKPVGLITDVLKDCSRPGDLVFDPFAGAGATMIAAETTGRRARLIEADPATCDLIVRRWQTFTNETARLAESSATFAELAKKRSHGPEEFVSTEHQ